MDGEILAAWVSRILLNRWQSFAESIPGTGKITGQGKEKITIQLVDFIRDFKDFISEAYNKKYNKKRRRDQLSLMDEEIVDALIVEQLAKGETEFIDRFIGDLYNYVTDEKYELSVDFIGSVSQTLSGKDISGVNSNLRLLSMSNPLLIPLTVDFILTVALSHYLINMYSELNCKFHGKEGLKEEEMIAAADDLIEKNPIDLYLITFSWDFYAKAFNERYQKLKAEEAKEMALAAFVVNAARVSLVAGVPCEGQEWEKTLTEAGKSTHPFVQISLTLYQLCNFIDRETNSRLLTTRLETFKCDYPAFYKLIGFQEDSHE